MQKKIIIIVSNTCCRWSEKGKSAAAGPAHRVKRTSMSSMSTPARRASWGPGPMTTSQVHVSQCQHRYISQKKKKTWKRHRHGRRGSHLQVFLILVALVYVSKDFLRNRSLPNNWIIRKIYRSYRDIGLHSYPHHQTKSEAPSFLLGILTPSSGYSEVPMQGPSLLSFEVVNRATDQEEAKICYNVSKSKKVTKSWVVVGLKLFVSLSAFL